MFTQLAHALVFRWGSTPADFINSSFSATARAVRSLSPSDDDFDSEPVQVPIASILDSLIGSATVIIPRHSVDRDEHRGLSLLLHLACIRFERLNSTHILCAQKLPLADEHFAPIHFANHTAARG